MSALRDAYGPLSAAGAVVYGVNPSSDASHRRFVEKLKLPYPLIVDAGARIARAFRTGWGPIVRRTVYVIAPDSTIAFAQRGAPSAEVILEAVKKAQSGSASG